jgi:cation transport ATPase
MPTNSCSPHFSRFWFISSGKEWHNSLGWAVLEKLAAATVVLLDKTGTLTHGGPAITQIQSGPNFSKEVILNLAASVDQYSSRIVAKASVQQANVQHL